MKASIILVTWAPTQERLELLKGTLDSLEKSTNTEYELVVIDNGPKKQAELLKDYKIGKLIHNNGNRGIGFGRNQGIQAASGEYISYIDNDLLFDKDWLSEGISILEEYPGEKIIISCCMSMHQIAVGPEKRGYFRGRLGPYFAWSRGCPAGTVWRRKDVEKVGDWPLHPKPGTKYCDKITRCGYSFVSLPFPKVAHVGLDSSYNYKKLMKGGKWKEEWDL